MVQIDGSITVEKVFSELGIHYKKLFCRKSVLYLCKIPSTGITFDLRYDENEYVRIWKIINQRILFCVAKKHKYKITNTHYNVIGFEVTDEGDVRLFSEQKVYVNAPGSYRCLTLMIKDYIEMIYYIEAISIGENS